jgi:uncharacterized protein YfkK (UPF0435 family)
MNIKETLIDLIIVRFDEKNNENMDMWLKMIKHKGDLIKKNQTVWKYILDMDMWLKNNEYMDMWLKIIKHKENFSINLIKVIIIELFGNILIWICG